MTAPMTTPADRPLQDCLDDFWQGRLPLLADRPEEPPAPAPDELGPSGVTVAGRELTAVLAPAYRRFTGAD
ncbi:MULTISPECIES: hypothetical protein [Kitasatospora]|uniref:Uncharacterized protein n=2 Tax=Kitasatospora TaxID=2063 RepID=A0ABT1J5M8_9ACTN|nr:hypothetical protein [Kitasatospora paracochleata]MCP2312745.1 hypothetical protein [Kitasatospora paracochleata]